MADTEHDTTAPVIVTVGRSGSGVRHYGYTGKYAHLFTRCGAERRHVGTNLVRVVEGATEATCRSCNPAAPAAPKAPVRDEAVIKVNAIRYAASMVADYADLIATVAGRGETVPTDLIDTLARFSAKLAEAVAR